MADITPEKAVEVLTDRWRMQPMKVGSPVLRLDANEALIIADIIQSLLHEVEIGRTAIQGLKKERATMRCKGKYQGDECQYRHKFVTECNFRVYCSKDGDNNG